MATYYIKGNKSPVNLTQNEFIAEGGEGKIFGLRDRIFKIYSDLSNMIPVSKIQELQILDSKNIIIPRDIVLDNKSRVVGFTMNYVQNTIPLCKLFTNDFRNTNSIKPEVIPKLVDEMIKTIVFIHDKKCLIVDGNEMNYLVDKNTFMIPYFIDVNSYQTPHFPATAIMPSIMDYSASKFTELTDWYSFAIVSCQLFIGIHPFKGRHPNYQAGQLVERMKNNISIFNKDVKVPFNCRDFSHIPREFMEWYQKVFEKGERTAPPKVVGLLNITPVQVKIIQTTKHFEISFISKFKDEIIRCRNYYQKLVVKTKNEIYIDKVGYQVTKGVDVLFDQKSMEMIFVKIDNNIPTFYNPVTKSSNTINIRCTEKLVINNTLYIRNEGDLIELDVRIMNDKIIPSVKNSWNIMPKSSQVLGGMIYQSVLGKSYLVIPVPNENGNSICKIIRSQELDGYRIVDGKHDNGVVVITGFKANEYIRFIFRLNGDNSYHCRADKVNDTNINFVTLDNGIVVMINDDDSMEVFHKNPKSDRVDKIIDPMINSSMILYRDGIRVLFSSGTEMYQLKMK